MIKTFVSYHHRLDQNYKDALVSWATSVGLIEDLSVNSGEIDDTLPTQAIRRKIRDEYLRDSVVTILLLGEETRYRKHVDWEIKSSMIDGSVNRRSGILVINLPTSGSSYYNKSFIGENEAVYPDASGWFQVKGITSYSDMYPSMPKRLTENLAKDDVRIPVVPWDRVYGKVGAFDFLLKAVANARYNNQYDTSRAMRMKNFNPSQDFIDTRR